MNKPVNTGSLEEILDIVEEEIDEDLPREDIQDQILKQNRDFYRNASENEINKKLLVEIMTIEKIMDVLGEDELVTDMQPAKDRLRSRISE